MLLQIGAPWADRGQTRTLKKYMSAAQGRNVRSNAKLKNKRCSINFISCRSLATFVLVPIFLRVLHHHVFIVLSALDIISKVITTEFKIIIWLGQAQS